MSFGITNITNVTMQNITDISNASSYSELLINVNNIVYNGWLYFFLLLTAWIIFYLAARETVTSPLENIMYGGAIISIISFFIRAIFVLKDGIRYGLLTDFQMWIFPVITIVLALILWGTKE